MALFNWFIDQEDEEEEENSSSSETVVEEETPSEIETEPETVEEQAEDLLVADMTEAPEPTVTVKSPYQKNMEDVTEQEEEKPKNWYDGDAPTYLETLAAIGEISKTDTSLANDLFSELITYQTTPDAGDMYRPYMYATNEAADYLASRGYDLSKMDSKWFEKNKTWQNYLVYNGNTMTPSAPTKKSSQEEIEAYALYQYQLAVKTTETVDQEWAAMQQEAAYWASRTDLNMSDDQIVAKIASEKEKKYPTLASMDSSLNSGKLVEINHGTEYSMDNLYGVIWSVRNNNTTGSVYGDTILYAMGAGAKWQENPDITARLDQNAETYAPYTVSSTLNEACAYYGVASFDRKWLADNKPDGSDATEVKFYKQVENAIQFTEDSQAEAAELDAWLAKELETATNPEDVMKKFNRRLSDKWNNLQKLDDGTENSSVKKYDSLLDTTAPINYSYYDVQKRVEDACAFNSGKYDYYATMDAYGAGTGTTQDRANAQAADSRVKDGVSLLDESDLGGAERSHLITNPSTTTQQAKNDLEALVSGENNIPVMTQGQVSSDYVSGYMPIFSDVKANESAKKELSNLTAANDKVLTALREIRDDWINGEDTEATRLFKGLYDGTSWDQDGDLRALYKMVTGNELPKEIYSDARRSDAAAFYSYICGNYAQQEANGETPWMLTGYEDRKKQLEDTIASTEGAQAKLDEYNSDIEYRIGVYENAGIDCTELKTAMIASEVLGYFSDYEASVWEPYSLYDSASHAMGENGTVENVLAATDADTEKYRTALAAAQELRQYVEDTGIVLPDNYSENLDRYIEKLERTLADHDYFAVRANEDFDTLAAKGEEMAKKNGLDNYMKYTAGSGIQKTEDPLYSVMSEDEKKTVYYLLAGGELDSTFTNTNAGFLSTLADTNEDMSDEEKAYYRAAAYIEFLKDNTYGVLHTRLQETVEKEAAEEVDKGFWSGAWANLKAVASAPFDALASGAYLLERATSGKEYNPENKALNIGAYAEAVNTETGKAIHETFKDNEFMDTLASGAYEIAYNRGRSMANSMFFSFLGNATDLAVVNEFLGAAPMATGAMAAAIADAKDKGAKDDEAYLLGGITFLAESVSEAITYGNIKEALQGSDDVVVRNVKDLLVDWMTKSGLQEMVGETFTEYVEQKADRDILGALSDHSDRVAKYAQEYGLDLDDPIQKEQAEEYARREELGQIVHTAIISYLSPGTDVLTSIATDQIRDYGAILEEYHKEKKTNSDTKFLDVMKEYKSAKERALYGPQEETPAAETQTAAPAEQARAETQTEQATEQAAEENKPLSKDDEAFIGVMNLLDMTAKSDANTQTAAISAIFGGEENTTSGDAAMAAAVSVQDLLGGLSNTVSTLKAVFTGAAKSAINLDGIKQAFQIAALSPSSESAKTVQSQEFKSATGEQKAAMLDEAAQKDANKPIVQKEMSGNILESRIAIKEKGLIANGALDGVRTFAEAAELASQNLSAARESLSERQNETKAKSDAVADAANAVTENPTTENKNAVTAALGELDKAISVEKEYEQHLENVTNANDKAYDEYMREKKKALASIREEATAAVQQEDQARAEAAAQKAGQDRIAQEAEAKAQEEEVENNNIARTVADDIIDEHFPLATEEQKEKIREITKKIQSDTAAQTETDKVLARRNFVNSVAKKFNLTVNIGDTTQGGKYLVQNASVNPETRTITLDQSATVGDAMYAYLIHEVTHIAEQSGLYDELADALLTMKYGDDTDQMNADIQAKQDLYVRKLTQMKEQGADIDLDAIDSDYAKQEIVADLMGNLFLDEEGNANTELLNRFAAESPSVARRILDAIKSFLKKMVGIEGETLTQAQQIADTLEQALNETNKNAQTAEQKYSVEETETSYRVATPITTEANGTELDGELPGGTVTKYSLSSWTDSEKDRVRADLIKKGFSMEQAEKWISDTNGIAALIAADRDRLDFTADPEKTMLKPNAEYVKTLDASTLCAKRLLYQGTFDAIQHELPNTPLMPEDLIDLSNTMRDMGYETPCGICYVESRRRQLGKFTEQWLDSYDGEYKPTIDQVTTTDGLEDLRQNHPQAYQDFVSAMNKKGTMNPKVVQLRTDYRGEISDMTDGQVQKVKSIGGLRIQSFSDFETPHLLDMTQAVLDMASKDLTAQAYTKVPNFAWVFGDTGIKINLSEIGKGIGYFIDGGQTFDEIASMPYEEVKDSVHLEYDDTEGMPHDEAIAVRSKYSKNVGTILVGINDEHIIAAMAADDVDFIIPFHKSGWSKSELEKMPVLNGYDDYTDTQNEKAIIGTNDKGGYETESLEKSKRVNFQPVGENGYWDFDKTGTENAETYLEMCAEDGRLPKFSQFLVDNGDGSFSLPQGDDYRSTAIRKGYWKTLTDFKMYDNEGNGAPQQAVTPNINMPEAFRVLGEYSLDRNGISRESNNDLPVAQPVVDRYVEEYKAKHPLDENRVRYSLPIDAPYLNAVNRGDTEEAQRLVDEAAERAGYTLSVYHGTGDEFNRFERGNEGIHLGDYNQAGQMATIKNVFNGKQNSNVKKLYAKISNPFVIGGDIGTWTPQNIAKVLVDRNAGETQYGYYGNYVDISGSEISLTKEQLDKLLDLEDADEWEVKDEYWDVIADVLNQNGYDGIKYLNEYEGDKNSSSYIALRPEDVKSADPVTYDDQGRVLPLSERFNTLSNDVRYSLPSDAPYLSAVNHGDMEEAQRMVDEKAKGTGYTDKAYHGTDAFGFTEFNTESSDGLIFVSYSARVAGTYASSDDATVTNISDAVTLDKNVKDYHGQELADVAKTYVKKMEGSDVLSIDYNPETDTFMVVTDESSYYNPGFTVTNEMDESSVQYYLNKEAENGKSNVYQLYTKPGNQLVIEADSGWNEIPAEAIISAAGQDSDAAFFFSTGKEYDTNTVGRWARDNGYDSVRINDVYDGGSNDNGRNGYGDIGIFFNQNDVKSADTVTYDNDGNVIPLSERFQTENPDIRYSLPSDNILEQQIRYYMGENNTARASETEGQSESTENTGTIKANPQRQFGSKTAQNIGDLRQEVKDYLLNNSDYVPDTNANQLDRAIDWVQSHSSESDPTGLWGTIEDMRKRSFNSMSVDGQARIFAAMAIASSDAVDDVGVQTELAQMFNKSGTPLAQALQARKLFRMMTKAGRISILQKEVDNINQQLKDKGKWSEATNVTLDNFILQAAAVAKTEEDFKKVQKAARDSINEQIPVSWKEKAVAWRMFAMLSGTTTHVRNIVGNMLMVPTVSTKNKLGAVGEIIAQATGTIDQSERTKTLKPIASKDKRDFSRNLANKIKDTLTGEGKYKEGDQRQRERKVFGTKDTALSKTIGKGIQKAMDAVGTALEAEDWVFLKGHFRRAMSGLMEARGLSPADMTGSTLENAIAYAVQEAQKATYRDASPVAEALGHIDKLYTGDNPTMANGLKFLQFVINTRFPFKKTPVNIVKRGVEYSVVGLGKSVTYDMNHLMQYFDAKKNNYDMPKTAITPTEFIDKFSSGLTGVGITLLGLLAGRFGLARAAFDPDDPDDMLAKLKGEQEYSVKPGAIADSVITSIGRLFDDSFKFELFDEDICMDLDWAAPASLPFFTGVTAASMIEDVDDDGTVFEKVVKGITGMFEPMLDMSMLQSVNEALKTNQYSDQDPIWQFMFGTASSYVSSMFPTFFSKVGKLIDPVSRTVYTESGDKFSELTRAIGNIKNKIPFLSTENNPYRDSLGNIPDKVLSPLIENFVSPASVTNVKNDDEVLNELGRLLEATKNNPNVDRKKILPSSPDKTIKVGSETIKLNAKQNDQMKEEQGAISTELLGELINRAEYQAADDETRASMVADVYSYANKIAKYHIDNRVSLNDSNHTWIEDAYRNNNAVDEIVKSTVAKNRTAYIKQYSTSLAKALDANNQDDLFISMEYLKKSDATDAEIRTYVSNYFRPLYKSAYRDGDETTLNEITDKLYDLDIGYTDKQHFKKWRKSVDDGEDEDEEELDTSWLNRNNY